MGETPRWHSQNPERDWVDDFTHENGNYCCRCTTCGHEFVGHKRRLTCRVCVATFPIRDFHDPDFAWLSNFFVYPFRYRGFTWRCAEGAYQASKATDDAWVTTADAFSTYTGAQAKQWGRRIVLRPDWDAIKLSVMYDVLCAKFAEPELRAALLATGDAHLEEGNTWNDTFWGTVNGFGHNHLGRLLMQLRTELRGNDE